MIGFIIVAIILYEIFGKNNTGVSRKVNSHKDIIIFAIIALIAIRIILGVIGGMFKNLIFASDMIGFGAFGLFGSLSLIGLISAAIPIVIIAAVITIIVKAINGDRNISSSGQTVNPDKQSQVSGSRINYSFDNKFARDKYLRGAQKISKSESKRMKIVQRFNKKYNLNLRDNEIETIVKASYMDYGWEREVADMARDYDSESQWYNYGPANWLRAYLHAFNVQSISSNFNMQHQVVYDSYVNVFECVNPADCKNIEDCIRRMNERFYTSFDDITFMIAYNFLEANGKHYELPKVNIIEGKDDMADLKRKYDATKERYEEEKKETSIPGI